MVTLKTNVTDPIGDMLTRIRNANMIYKRELLLPVSKTNEHILEILKREGYIGSYVCEGDGVPQAFRVQLKYGKDRERTITDLKRISKPGRRVYVGHDEVPRVLGGLGIAIISTSQGVMTGREASRKGIGGEILAYVW